MSASDVKLKGQVLAANPLPPYSIEDPLPSADGCTISSIYHPQWTFSHFKVDGNTSAVGFNVILQTQKRGFQYPIPVTQDVAAGDGWFSCAIEEGLDTEEPLWPTACSLQYKPATKELIVKADWICVDLDPERP